MPWDSAGTRVFILGIKMKILFNFQYVFFDINLEYKFLIFKIIYVYYNVKI